MTLLNHLSRLFEDRKTTAKNLGLSAEKRIKLWEEHLENHRKREALCTFFNYAKVNDAINDWPKLESILDKMQSLISEEFVHIHDEEKNEAEILADLEKMISKDHKAEIENLNGQMVYETVQQKNVLKLFQKLFALLQLELHAIKLIKRRSENMKTLLLYLFNSTFFVETSLLKSFYKNSYFDENLPRHQMITKFARAILLEEEIKDEILSDEEKFVREMVKQMAPAEPVESPNEYRELGENIYDACLEQIGAPWKDSEDLTVALRRIDRLIKNDAFMYKVVKKQRKKYTDVQIKQVIDAFRRAHQSGHFMEMEEQLAT